MSMRMKINKCYQKAFKSHHRYLVMKGGAGSGKSIAAVAGDQTDCETMFAAKALLGALNWTTLWYRPRKGELESERLAIAEEVHKRIES